MEKTKKEINVIDELKNFGEYLSGESSEKAKQHLLYPLFQKLFPKLKIESNAQGADIYIEGALVVESKTKDSQWLEGFYQALHYSKKGLTYNTIMVVAQDFVAFWKVNKIPYSAVELAHKADALTAPNKIGKENAAMTSKSLKIEIKESAIYWLAPKDLLIGLFSKDRKDESNQIKGILNDLESDRIRINPRNFIETIKAMMPFFEKKLDAIHCFYSIVHYWDATSTVTESPNGTICVTGFKGKHRSEDISISSKQINGFKKFVEGRTVYTNESDGLTADYYFSRFDEVLAEIDPEYMKQHGIFFTDDNLSKFALWFANETFSTKIHENYIVFDPAGGSGNLISSWRNEKELKHKVISELQPDLLKTIEKRMMIDPFHIRTGFTIVPKTIDNKGLNFLLISAKDYLNEIKLALKESANLAIDKPIAFLLNPPYKNTDENEKERKGEDLQYKVDDSIIELTGKDAGKERYVAFLGQILNISKEQVKSNLRPVVMIFTPTSWLIPRTTYVPFREKWDKHFKYHSGFIVKSNEWFKLPAGQDWGVTFTIWTYEEKSHKNKVKVLDLTHLKKGDLGAVHWNAAEPLLRKELKSVIRGTKNVSLDNSRGDIREWVGQKMYDFKRDATQAEIKHGNVFGGLPLTDERRGNKKTYGIADSNFIGFMDDCTPVRIKQDSSNRQSILPDRVWFRLDNDMKGGNRTQAMNGAPDKYGYCASDLISARATFSWFALTKALNGNYPIWANQNDIWKPEIPKKYENYWYSLCFAFVLAENRCVVTKFEADNPIKGVQETLVDNPLCPTNRNSFWSKVLDKEIISRPLLAKELVDKIKALYEHWNLKYCKGQNIYSKGLENEPYFKCFNYRDFLTPHSGLIQIRKYAELNEDADLLTRFAEISEITKRVKNEIYRLLVEEFNYFD